MSVHTCKCNHWLCPHATGGLLFAVNGHSFEGDNKAQGFTIDARSGSILEHWNLPVPKVSVHLYSVICTKC